MIKTVSLLLLAVWLTIAAPAVAQVCGPDTAPAQASAQGLTCEIFWDDFPGTANACPTTVDCADTLAPMWSPSNPGGKKWSTHMRWPGLAGGNPGWQTFPTTTLGDVFVDPGGGGVTIYPTNNTYDIFLMSCATNGVANQWLGAAWVAPFYTEVTITSDIPPGRQVGNTWWPAAWMMTTEWMAAPQPTGSNTIRNTEIDIIEDTDTSVDHSGTTTRLFFSWLTDNTGGNTYPGQQDYGTYFTSDTNKRYGNLVIPSQLNSGTGYMKGYRENILQTPTPTWAADDTLWSPTNTQHYCMLLSGAYHQAFTIKSVRVWGPQPISPPPAHTPAVVTAGIGN